MAVRFSSTKEFTKAQLAALYEAAKHPSAKDPVRLKAAAAGSSRVISAWEGKRLVGLIRAIDDGVMTAYVCETVVCPGEEEKKIACELGRRMREAYGEAFRLDGKMLDSVDKIGSAEYN